MRHIRRNSPNRASLKRYGRRFRFVYGFSFGYSLPPATELFWPRPRSLQTSRTGRTSGYWSETTFLSRTPKKILVNEPKPNTDSGCASSMSVSSRDPEVGPNCLRDETDMDDAHPDRKST